MNPIAYNLIHHLSNEFTNPERASRLMRDYMKKAIKLSNTTMTKDTILKFNKSKVGLKDVEDIGESVLSKMKSSDKSRKDKYDIVKDLMKHKLKDAIKCTKITSTELNKSNDNLSKVVRKGTFVRNEFMEVVDKEINEVWKQAKEKKNEKVDWNVQKHIGQINRQEGTFKGILVGDSELEEFEKKIVDIEKNKNDNKAVVYADIKVSKNEEEILCLPPDHTVFPKVDIEEFDTEM